jgi:polar amino acid transport system substrate-binding protein
MKRTGFLWLAILILGLSLVIAGCGQAEEKETNSNDTNQEVEAQANNESKEKTTLEIIKERGYMVAGLDDTFAPMGFRDKETNELIGFDIDMGKEIAKRMGIEKIEWQPTAWEGVVQSLKNKNFDVIISGMTITPSRQEQINFSVPYVNQSIVILVQAGNEDIASVEDLKGKVIGTQSGSSGYEAAKDIEGVKEIVQYPQFPQALMDLKIGRTAAVIIDITTAKHFMSEQPDAYKIAGIVQKELYGIGIRKEDTDLKAELDRILNEMKEDGTLKKISIKWFEQDVIPE